MKCAQAHAAKSQPVWINNAWISSAPLRRSRKMAIGQSEVNRIDRIGSRRTQPLPKLT